MAVCQISIITHPKHPASLLISRLEHGLEPVTLKLPGFSSLRVIHVYVNLPNENNIFIRILPVI